MAVHKGRPQNLPDFCIPSPMPTFGSELQCKVHATSLTLSSLEPIPPLPQRRRRHLWRVPEGEREGPFMFHRLSRNCSLLLLPPSLPSGGVREKEDIWRVVRRN